jgi:preprotein translocase subunit YajC
MSDMNSLTMILLTEASVILLVALIVVLWLQIKSKNKQRKAVEQLVSQIKKQSKTRTEETGSFLQEVYDLSDTELTVAVKEIDKQERRFFQKLVDVLSRSEPSQITSLDASVAELVDTYKSLKPKPVEVMTEQGEAGSNAEDLEELRAKNETLTEELKITRETMAGMIAEFGNMFGGGEDNDLDSGDVADRVATSVAPPEGEKAEDAPS